MVPFVVEPMVLVLNVAESIEVVTLLEGSWELVTHPWNENTHRLFCIDIVHWHTWVMRSVWTWW